MEEKVLEILSDNKEEIMHYEGNNMFAEGIINSFELLSIIGDLEDEFDIEIDAKYVVEKNFANKEAIVDLVKRILEG